ncbi:MAG: hypothetical protein R2742_00825 [Micropruina glycogenica]
MLDYCACGDARRAETAQITQERWEEDDWPNGDDLVGTSTFNVQERHHSAPFTRHLVDGELGMEDMPRRSGCGSRAGVTSPWTGWQKSGVQAFYN